MNYQMLLIVLLAPLIASFVLFKFLNSSAKVKGKVIKGFFLDDVRIDLGGAFAAYFVLVALLLYFFEYQRANPEEEVWLVKGKILFEPEDATFSYSEIQTFLHPPPYAPSMNGLFEMNVVVPTRLGKKDFPIISFHLPNFKPIVLDIDEAGDALINMDEGARKISITQDLVLKYTGR